MPEKPRLPKNLLRRRFEEHLNKWRKEKPEECLRLIYRLILWASAGGEDQTLWQALEKQIYYTAGRKRNMTPKNLIDELFSAPTADEFMFRFKIL